MTATHPFVPSGRFKVSSIGRRLEYCDYPGCGKVRLGLSHEPVGRRREQNKPKAVVAVVEAPRPEPPPRAEPWQVGMLKDAVGHVLDLPVDAIGWRLRLRILDVSKAFELDSDDPPLMKDPVIDEPTPIAAPAPRPTTRPSQRHVYRKLIRSLTGNWHDLAERALDNGWTVKRTGSGHIRFEAPDSQKFVITPASPGEGRGFQNARARFKSAGLNTEGL